MYVCMDVHMYVFMCVYVYVQFFMNLCNSNERRQEFSSYDFLTLFFSSFSVATEETFLQVA